MSLISLISEFDQKSLCFYQVADLSQLLSFRSKYPHRVAVLVQSREASKQCFVIALTDELTGALGLEIKPTVVNLESNDCLLLCQQPCFLLVLFEGCASDRGKTFAHTSIQNKTSD